MKKLTILSLVAVTLVIGGTACSPGSEDTSKEAAATIEAASGGSLTSQDGSLTLEIPPGALSEDTEISLRPVSAEDLPEELTELAGGRGGYLLEPDGLTFQEPVEVSLQIDAEDLTVEGVDG
ncbi:MAG: hypothetical protein PVJ07_07390, partial [Anaerolineales bacterium]